MEFANASHSNPKPIGVGGGTEDGACKGRTVSHDFVVTLTIVKPTPLFPNTLVPNPFPSPYDYSPIPNHYCIADTVIVLPTRFMQCLCQYPSYAGDLILNI